MILARTNMVELPDKCGNCDLFVKEVFPYGLCPPLWVDANAFATRPDNCPLVETISDKKTSD